MSCQQENNRELFSLDFLQPNVVVLNPLENGVKQGTMEDWTF